MSRRNSKRGLQKVYNAELEESNTRSPSLFESTTIGSHDYGNIESFSPHSDRSDPTYSSTPVIVVRIERLVNDGTKYGNLWIVRAIVKRRGDRLIVEKRERLYIEYGDCFYSLSSHTTETAYPGYHIQPIDSSDPQAFTQLKPLCVVENGSTVIGERGKVPVGTPGWYCVNNPIPNPL